MPYDDTCVELRISPNESLYIYKRSFKKWIWEAQKENSSEHNITKYEAGGCTVNANVLIKNGVAYGFKFDFKTSTSSATKHCRIPKLIDN